jgi:hypothetical protein
MKYKLPILALLILLAAGWAGWRARERGSSSDSDDITAVPLATSSLAMASTAATDASLRSAADVLDDSIQMIEACRSLHCRIRHRANLYGQHFKGSGEYVQGPSRRHQFRLELNLRAGEESATLLQVCDGRSMWTYRLIGDEPTLSHVDLRRVQDELNEHDSQVSGYPWRDLGGIGGLPHLLRGLDESFQFGKATPGTLDGSPVWILQGAWRPEPLKRLLADQTAAIDEGGEIDWSRLSPHAPDHVAVIIGHDDRLPYRIEFRRGPGDAGTITAPLAASDESTAMLLVMEFFRVRLGDDVDPGLFIYDPLDLHPHDHTERYTAALRESGSRRSQVGPATMGQWPTLGHQSDSAEPHSAAVPTAR